MAQTSTTGQVAEYKGRKYRLLWSGQTKFGRRAKLGFFDGSKEFWADEAAVTVLSPSARPSAGRRADSGAYDHNCWACRDARRAGREACDRCLFDEYDC